MSPPLISSQFPQLGVCMPYFAPRLELVWIIEIVTFAFVIIYLCLSSLDALKGRILAFTIVPSPLTTRGLT